MGEINLGGVKKNVKRELQRNLMKLIKFSLALLLTIVVDAYPINQTVLSCVLNKNLYELKIFLKSIRDKSERSQIVNEPDWFGTTVLHWACCGVANSEMIHLLIDEGADVHAISRGNKTPLHDAVMWSTAEVVSALVSRGADVMLQDSLGYTPLDLAFARFKTYKKNDVENKNIIVEQVVGTCRILVNAWRRLFPKDFDQEKYDLGFVLVDSSKQVFEEYSPKMGDEEVVVTVEEDLIKPGLMARLKSMLWRSEN